MRGLLVGALVAALGAIVPEAEARTRCGGQKRVRGIDVSKWQGAVNWRAVARTGVRFAFIRVSDGVDYPDPHFAANWRAARRARIIRGAYQYFRPDQDPIAQADLLLKRMGPLREGDLPPVLDLETSGGLSQRAVLRKVKRWIDRVKRATGVTPIIYSNAKGWREITGDTRRWRRARLWVAHYHVRCPDTPRAWRRWTFHQFTDSGSVGGIAGPVDLNDFNGTLRQLRRLTLRDERSSRRKHREWKRRRAREQRTARK